MLGEFTMGVPGAAIGYCQALFQQGASPESHTKRVTRLLTEIGAPWANSHEIYWGYSGGHIPEEFIASATRPLAGLGRIPVVITALDPTDDWDVIQSIVNTSPPVFPGETILLRVVLSGRASLYGAARLSADLLRRARETIEMPGWWPLWQGNMVPEDWTSLRNDLGDTWDYANIAVNPFTPADVLDVIRDQVTVGQIPLGLADGVAEDGSILLPIGMKVSGARDGESYLLDTYMQRLARLDAPPTLIVIGPSAPNWSDQVNQDRIAALLPHLRRSCESLWGAVDPVTREEVWQMSA